MDEFSLKTSVRSPVVAGLFYPEDADVLSALIEQLLAQAHVASALSNVWGGPETLVLTSSDLSHCLPYNSARKVDAATATAIVNCHIDITQQQACGAAGINGLLSITQQLGLEVTEIARQNSGDTAGNVRRVVGYGAFAIHESRHHAS